MVSLLKSFFAQFSEQNVIIVFILILFIYIFSTALAVALLVRLPPTYFSQPQETNFQQHHPVIRWIGLALKNIFGALLILAGIILSLPGIPGPGILTLFIGVLLLNFPYKRELEHKFIRSPRILHNINRLRKRFSQPPFIIE